MHIELGDVCRPFLVWRGCTKVAFQYVRHLLIAHAGDMPRALLRPDHRAQPYLLHQPLYALVVDRLRH